MLPQTVPPGDAPSAPRERPAMLALYARLFDDLGARGVDGAVWKGLDELPEALLGRGDVDLYVRPRDRARFLAALREHRFVRVETHKCYPGVEHYYGFDEASGSLCHLHCYFRIVTGESHIKQYVVPIEGCLDALPSALGPAGVPELHPRLQEGLDLFRRRVKLSCVPGALLFHRERDAHGRERALLRERLAAVRPGPSRVDSPDGWLEAMEEVPSLAREVLAGLGCRRRYRHWNRFAPGTTPLHRYGALLSRALGKLRRRRKRLAVGVQIDVGAGPAGERIERELSAWLGRELQVRTFDLSAPVRPRERRRVARALSRALAEGAVIVCRGGAAPDLALGPDPHAGRDDGAGPPWRRRVWDTLAASQP